MFYAPLSLGVALLLSPASAPVSGSDDVFRPPSIDELFRDLVASDWQRVEYAKLHLVSRQKEPIPRLIALMSDDARVPLTETGDLIYPGAKEFYGHGFIVDYDLDVLAVRAGWVLEDLTFQDFGFR